MASVHRFSRDAIPLQVAGTDQQTSDPARGIWLPERRTYTRGEALLDCKWKLPKRDLVQLGTSTKPFSWHPEKSLKASAGCSLLDATEQQVWETKCQVSAIVSGVSFLRRSGKELLLWYVHIRSLATHERGLFRTATKLFGVFRRKPRSASIFHSWSDAIVWRFLEMPSRAECGFDCTFCILNHF